MTKQYKDLLDQILMAVAVLSAITFLISIANSEFKIAGACVVLMFVLPVIIFEVRDRKNGNGLKNYIKNLS
ncbi:hypothetical protein bcgnr5378_37700 [Bacillus cereus]|uniref:Uncharacterized protein n=1 Tax=Bacillus cereus TaxID=1396 RepID=A0A164QMC5_BACCE|nr:hypothetical protein [Bacillus cereus]KZD71900.1 hypothetical protein B4088_0361 [Bacillus cereus]HDR8320423.1 hypothetical protein [Bacillus cereus]HDR8329421.1 hypothetical protein [Bacillus cereus]HDR8335975.1 hypothetical protein [Bacillus cereus]